MRKIVSMILVFVMTMLMLSSCNLITSINEMISGNSSQNKDEHNSEGVDGNHPRWKFYPEGYTAGFPGIFDQPGPMVEYWWVETYDECVAAMQLLKSHNSTFDESIIFTYDDELFDTKFLFIIDNNNRFTEEIKFGDNPFDRKAGSVEIESYAFFKEATIEEINYGSISDYSFNTIVRVDDDSCANNKDFSYDTVECKWNDYTNQFDVKAPGSRYSFFSLSSFGYKEDEKKAMACIEAVLNSIVFIGFD